MKGPSARPDEMSGIGFLQLGIARLCEAKRLLGSPAMTHIRRNRGNELEIMCMEAEDP